MPLKPDPQQSIANAINAGVQPMSRAVDRLHSGAAAQHPKGAKVGLSAEQHEIDLAHTELTHHLHQASRALPKGHPAKRALKQAQLAADEIKANAAHYQDDAAIHRLNSHPQVAQQVCLSCPVEPSAKERRRVEKMLDQLQRDQDSLWELNRIVKRRHARAL